VSAELVEEPGLVPVNARVNSGWIVGFAELAKGCGQCRRLVRRRFAIDARLAAPAEVAENAITATNNPAVGVSVEVLTRCIVTIRPVLHQDAYEAGILWAIDENR
tara:strand:+ start:1017 stop:1331 length:315 start_codon:yes stop_codon:yes gene_type:complete